MQELLDNLNMILHDLEDEAAEECYTALAV